MPYGVTKPGFSFVFWCVFWVTGSSDSENVARNGVVDQRNAASAATGLPLDSEAVRSRRLPPPPADRSLPKPPAVRDLQNVDPEVNASRQSFRLAMGNACELDQMTRVCLL